MSELLGSACCVLAVQAAGVQQQMRGIHTVPWLLVLQVRWSY